MDWITSHHSLKYAVVVVIIGFMPSIALASLIRLTPAQTSLVVGQSSFADVLLDTDATPLNAVSLVIRVPSIIRIKSIETSGSVIQFWVHPPAFTKTGITLEGGSPGELTGRGLKVARIHFSAAAVGVGTLALDSSSAVLLADGNGTPSNASAVPMSIVVTARLAQASIPPEATPTEKPVSKDRRSPKSFSIEIGQDAQVFNGKSFAAFFTTDRDTGVARYEIRQGSGPYAVARSPYLLSDQDLHSVIRVRAYDEAGNMRESVYPGLLKRLWWWLTTIFRHGG